MSVATQRLDYLVHQAARIRLLSLEMTTKAGSGHPTTAMSMADILSVLYFDQMIYDPRHPESPENDELVLSKGHGAPGLYAAMHLAGVLGDADLMSLRESSSPLEGHPVPRLAGIRLATGSLGQGLSAGIGLALAIRWAKVGRFVYVILGDGELAEGNVWEAVNLAPLLGLENLIAIVDVNRLGQSEATAYEWDLDAYRRRLESFGWAVYSVDGHNTEAVADALRAARREGRPTAVLAKTVKGKGVGFLENAEGRHGKAVDEEELEEARAELRRNGLDRDPGDFRPTNLRSFVAHDSGPRATPSPPEIRFDGDEVATRDGYGKALAALGRQDPSLVVLDGDVKNSTRAKFFFSEHPERAVECYIAEQNMVGIAVGLQCRGFRPHVATFAAFLTRAHDQIRMAAYSRADIKLSGSHSGISIGQDGPSQMGLEDIAMMRSVLDAVVLSPADAYAAVRLAAAANAYHGISYVRTIRGGTPLIYTPKDDFVIGGSRRFDPEDQPLGAVVATGITVHEALAAQRRLVEVDIPVVVVDAYSIKPLDRQGLRELAEEIAFVVTVEDHYPEGGLGEAVSALLSGRVPVDLVAVRRRPHSGTPARLLSEQGIDAAGIVSRVKHMLRAVQ